jgi:hypothetical protein
MADGLISDLDLSQHLAAAACSMQGLWRDDLLPKIQKMISLEKKDTDLMLRL